jgi:hypothetical protein
MAGLSSLAFLLLPEVFLRLRSLSGLMSTLGSLDDNERFGRGGQSIIDSVVSAPCGKGEMDVRVTKV